MRDMKSVRFGDVCCKGFHRNSSGSKFFVHLREVSNLKNVCLGRFHCKPISQVIDEKALILFGTKYEILKSLINARSAFTTFFDRYWSQHFNFQKITGKIFLYLRGNLMLSHKLIIVLLVKRPYTYLNTDKFLFIQ